MIFFTSDIHFGHKNIIKYNNRPFSSVAEMDQKIIENWNRVVSQSDTVYHLGDFAFSKIDRIVEILKQLNGNKVMILGNHDDQIKNNKQLLIDNKLVKELSTYKEIKIENQFICLFHYGCRVWNKAHHGSWLLYGHSHGSLPPYGKSTDVGMDAPFILGQPTYRPYSFKEIQAFLNTREIKTEDHHGD